MVFCGKASLSCKNCRIRRIKCNKLEPECSQCIRAGKKCPGYRDQLSLMFRDETVKVRRKFEEGNNDSAADTAGSSSVATPVTASDTFTFSTTPEPFVSPATNAGNNVGQFSAFQIAQRGPSLGVSDADKKREEGKAAVVQGLEGSFALDGAPAVSDSNLDGDGSPLATSRKQPRKRQGGSTSPAPSSSTHPTPPTFAAVTTEIQPPPTQSMILAPRRTPSDRGLEFYMEHYLYGHPESPKKEGEISMNIPWILDPAARLIASAVGMAGMANLTGDDQMQISAWQSYVTGLQMTARSLARQRLDTINNDMRSIVLLAMFEIVRGANESFGSANVHVMGAAALLRKFLPLFPPSKHPFRGLVQLCYSLLISCHASGIAMPPLIIEYVSSAYRDKPTDDQLMTKLLLTLTDFVNLAAYIHHLVIVDGRPDMVDLVVQALQLEARLIAWEHSVIGRSIWDFDVCKIATLPPEACYKGWFHLYSDVQTARIWSYYRWARILLNEILLDLIKQCPQSVAAGLAQLKVENGGAAMQSSKPKTAGTDTTNPTEKLRLKALRTIRKCAEETFISTPTYWRHPSISLSEYAAVASPLPVYGANGGTGVVGLMPTLFHLKVAACAPGIPREDFQWALSVIDIVWAYLGLRQARSLADKMRAHDEKLQRQSRGLDGTLLLTAGEATE